MAFRQAQRVGWIGWVALVALEPFLAIGAMGHSHPSVGVHQHEAHSHGIHQTCSHHGSQDRPSASPRSAECASPVAEAAQGTHSDDCSICRHLSQFAAAEPATPAILSVRVCDFSAQLAEFDVSDPAHRIAQPRSPPTHG